jgi:hypothetical protein
VRRYILNRLEEAEDRGLSICLGALDNELLRQGKGRAHRFPFTDVEQLHDVSPEPCHHAEVRSLGLLHARQARPSAGYSRLIRSKIRVIPLPWLSIVRAHLRLRTITTAAVGAARS